MPSECAFFQCDPRIFIFFTQTSLDSRPVCSALSVRLRSSSGNVARMSGAHINHDHSLKRAEVLFTVLFSLWPVSRRSVPARPYSGSKRPCIAVNRIVIAVNRIFAVQRAGRPLVRSGPTGLHPPIEPRTPLGPPDAVIRGAGREPAAMHVCQTSYRDERDVKYTTAFEVLQ